MPRYALLFDSPGGVMTESCEFATDREAVNYVRQKARRRTTVRIFRDGSEISTVRMR